jgi:ABC-type nitrate/sulfonate/bicarbonate transport system substrate-binding protein
VDGIGTTIPELLNYWVKGVPLTVIMPLSNSAGTEGIVVRADSPIKTVADLRGYPVAVDEQGILLFLLFNALRQENMTLDEIQRRSLEAVQVSRDIMSGTLEAGVTREPYLSALLATRQARLIYDSQPLQGLILDMLAINPEVAGEKAGVLQFLIDGLLRAQRFISEQPDQTLGIIADWRDQTPEEMQNQVARITFFDNDTTRTFFDSRYLQELLKVFEDYFQATSQPFPLVTFEDIIDASFVENAGAAAAEIPNGTPLEQEHAER